MMRQRPRSTLFPSTTLFRSRARGVLRHDLRDVLFGGAGVLLEHGLVARLLGVELREPIAVEDRDRKSTRLNSSHANISYAVFCLKKKYKSDVEHFYYAI